MHWITEGPGSPKRISKERLRSKNTKLDTHNQTIAAAKPGQAKPSKTLTVSITHRYKVRYAVPSNGRYRNHHLFKQHQHPPTLNPFASPRSGVTVYHAKCLRLTNVGCESRGPRVFVCLEALVFASLAQDPRIQKSLSWNRRRREALCVAYRRCFG